MSDVTDGDSRGYAVEVANGSYEWYRNRAILARRLHRSSEVTIVVVSTLIPLVAVISPGSALIPAVLGAVVVVVTGLRSAFHWQEDYLRFSRAREAVEAERRLYRTHSAPYDDPKTREKVLVAAVTRIEQDEMGGWISIASRGREKEAIGLGESDLNVRPGGQ